MKIELFRGYLFKWGVYLQIRSIFDIAFFFDTRQVIEKTTNLHYNLCFILSHIHFFIGILFISGRNEWIYSITLVKVMRVQLVSSSFARLSLF